MENYLLLNKFFLKICTNFLKNETNKLNDNPTNWGFLIQEIDLSESHFREINFQV